MGKILISCFSASKNKNTLGVAKRMQAVLNCDLFIIEPVEEYTEADLDWTNKESRTTKEMEDRSFRPKIRDKVLNIDEYDTIILGFPVWWYTAPTIINTFIEENNLEGKKIYVYITSGSSSIDGSLNDLRTTYPNLNFIKGKRFQGQEEDSEILSWLE